MHSKTCGVVVASLLLAASAAPAQVVRGVMAVTGAEMHWWAGVARDATARLYDVERDSLFYTRLRLTDKYDQATITFRPRQDARIDLDKLHESIWATRLSGGTNSGVICLEITVLGEVFVNNRETVLTVRGTDQQFVLVDDVGAKPKDGKPSVLPALRESLAGGESAVSVTGYVDGWAGRWPTVLAKPSAKRPALMVTSFEKAKAEWLPNWETKRRPSTNPPQPVCCSAR